MNAQDWLDPPYEFFHPEPGEPFTLPVVRWEVGQAQREISDPPGFVVRPTIRFHLSEPFPPTGRMYVDFTNRGLILRVSFIYDHLVGELRVAGSSLSADRALRVLPEAEEPLMLKLTRRGRGVDTVYEVEVLEA